MVGNSSLISSRIVDFPRKFFLGYFILTLIMFTLSPWDWPLEPVFKFYAFNFGILIAFSIGFKNGAVVRSKLLPTSINMKHLNFILRISILLNIIFLYPKFLFNLNVVSASFDFIVNSIMKGFISPELAYAAKYENVNEELLSLSNPLVLFYNLFLPVIYIAVPLGIFFWERLKFVQRGLLIFIVICDILSYVAIGTNKGIFDVILITPWLLVARKPNDIFQKKITFKNIKRAIILVLILFVGILYFAQGNKGRKDDNFYYEQSTQKKANLDAPILAFIPDLLQNAYLALDSYLTQGYYALGLALDLEYSPTYGLGHSYFLTSIGEKIFGVGSISENTYEAKMDKKFGWGQFGKWHSFYVTMANDLTFPGVLLLVYFIAYYFSEVWIDVLLRRNIIAIPLFTLFVIMLFYFPANNQVLGFQSSSIVFWILFFLWKSQFMNRVLFRKFS